VGDGERVVRVEVNEGWAEVVLDRPQRKNALTGPLAVQLKDAVIRLNGDEEIAAIVLRGEGGSFCSGIDLKELQADPPHPWPLCGARTRFGTEARARPNHQFGGRTQSGGGGATSLVCIGGS